MDALSDQKFKRNIAYRFRIGDVMAGSPLIEGDRLLNVNIQGKEVVRVNIIANVIDKYIQEGEKKFGSLTLDDASGQIKAKVFGDDLDKLESINQGDTLLVIGLLRSWNNEIYLTPEIFKKKDPKFLLVRKLESDLVKPKEMDREKIAELKDKILQMVKSEDDNGGVDIDKIIMDLKEPPEVINAEIKKLLEDGVAYEPRPGKLRYLG